MKRRMVFGALGVGVLVAAGLASAGSGSAATGPGVVTSGATMTASESQAYWTPERMRAARPYPMPTVTKRPGTARNSTAVTGAPGMVAGSSDAAASARSVAPAAVAPVAFAYPYPFNRFKVHPTSLWKMSPWRVNGKLFFVQNGGSFVCSATSVVAPSQLRVWTAGHCVSDGAGHFNSSALFVPAYNGNSATLSVQRPYGSFPAVNFTTTTVWHTSGDLSRDLGSILVGRNGAGKTLAGAVGTAGFAWNQSDLQQWQDDAYPQAAPFNGKNMVECQAVTAARDTGIGGSGPAPLAIGCDMTGGSSGGSWRMRSGGAFVGYINSHNDYKYISPAQPLAMYGPYFDTLANAVRCNGETPGSLGC